MPLYEYQCDACTRRFERIQKFSDPPVDTCPACGGGPVQKLLSSPAIQFKGSGWYITDYARKGSESGSAGSGTPAGKDGAAAGATPADTKTEKTAADATGQTGTKSDAKADSSGG